MKIYKLILFIFCVLLLNFLSIFSQNKITQYEYWINNDFGNKVVQAVTPSLFVEVNTDIQLSNLKPGFNYFSIRFKDTDGNYSSVVNQVVWAFSSDASISAYEYWFDNNYSAKIQVPISNPSTNLDLNASIDASSISNGFHAMHIRFKDAGGVWTTLNSQFFYKAGNGGSSNNLITAYHYWFDNDVANIVYKTLSNPTDLVEVNFQINTATNAETLHFQFLDTAGEWSSVYTRIFIPEASFDVVVTDHYATFLNTTTFGKSYIWDFGDGTTDTTVNPCHTYKTPGTYQVILYVKNKLGADTTFRLASIKGVKEVIPNTGGNTGDVSIVLYGGGFTPTSTFKLTRTGYSDLSSTTMTLEKLGRLNGRFNLRTIDTGYYNIIVTVPNDTTYVLENAFHIVSGVAANPYASISGRNKILFNRWQSYNLTLSNTGNVDASGVPLTILIKKMGNMEVDIPNIRIIPSNYGKTQGLDTLYTQFPKSKEISNFYPDGSSAIAYFLYVPIIPANFSGNIEVKLKTSASTEISVWCGQPFYQSPYNQKLSECMKVAIFKAVKSSAADLVSAVVPGVGCLNDVSSAIWEPTDYMKPNPDNPDYDKPKSWSETIWNWGNFVVDNSLTIVKCASVIVPVAQAYEFAVEAVQVVNDIKKGIQEGRDCQARYKKDESKQSIAAVSSFDPNEMVGPTGYTADNWTTRSNNYTYSIFFENMSTATAPAQEVTIIDTLDKTKYNLSNFSFGAFYFGGNYYSPQTGLKDFSVDIDLRPTKELILRVTGILDTATGIATWHFTSLSPSTMNLPDDPDLGFLPPDVTSPEGEGFVSFTLGLINNLPNKTVINNKAKIVFDLNSPINTNEYANSLDLVPPTSKITGIYTTAVDTIYRLTMSGTDNQSGIREYALYVSVNDSDYVPLAVTGDNTYYLSVIKGNVYKLYSIALDSVGNEENSKSAYEVTTEHVSVEDGSLTQIASMRIAPNPAFAEVTIDYIVDNADNVEISVIDPLGNNNIMQLNKFSYEGKNQVKINISDIPIGIYYIAIRTKSDVMYKKMIIIR